MGGGGRERGNLVSGLGFGELIFGERRGVTLDSVQHLRRLIMVPFLTKSDMLVLCSMLKFALWGLKSPC